jgi:adenine-specific DNA-methyltransferase
MELKELKPRKALNKAFLKVKPNRTEIEGFKSHLIQLFDNKSETHKKNSHALPIAPAKDGICTLQSV